ncbi:MAG: phage portal protein family protein [Dietzia maris]
MNINEIADKVKEDLATKEPTRTKGYLIEKEDGLVEFSALSTKEKGTDGTYWLRGLPTNLDSNVRYEPISARGVQGYLGAYQRYAETDPDFQDALNTLVQNLQRGSWEIVPNEWIEEDELEKHNEIIKFIYQSLFNLKDGWKQFLQEWSTALITGFAIWEPVYTKEGELHKLAQRKSFIVEEWLFDKYERNLLAVLFRDAQAQSFTIPVEDLLIYSHKREGTNYEGKSVLRPLAFYIELKQYLLKTYAASAEVNGLGMKIIETNTESDASEDQMIVSSVSNARASSNPVISLPNGKTFKWLSPNGNIIGVKEMLDYCDQKIKSALSAEGSLLGFQNVGSFALASEQAKGEIASAQYFGELICDMFNKPDSPLRKLVDNKFGEQEYYPVMVFKAQKEAEMSEAKLDSILKAQAAGMPMTVDDWNIIRKSYGFAPVIDDQSDQVEEETELDFGCGHNHSKKKIELNAIDSSIDVERYQKNFAATEKKIAQILKDQGRVYRDRWIEVAGPATTPVQILAAKNSLASSKQMFIDIVKDELRKGLHESAALTMKEIGVITSLNQFNANMIPASTEQWVELEANRLGEHYFNVLNSYLEEQSVQELYVPFAVRKRPQTPTLSAIQKTVATYMGTIINAGRDATIQTIVNLTGDEAPIVAVRTSVLERTTCDTCRELDGSTAIVGSKEYMRLSPPNLCQGKGRCRCIWSYEMPDTQSYKEALAEIISGTI